ncbi:MAG: hypothetical protein IT319_04425 [Anaerolineae bacterium]|nr:hypothetical protein [Anaerolineae bacterium]
MFRIWAVGLFVSALLLVVALPSSGQTATLAPNSQVVVVGTVDLGQGVIMVNGYVIAPASAIQPALLHDGDLVVVIGYLLPDGATIQATSLELFDNTLTPTMTPTYTGTPPTATPTPTGTLSPTPQATWTPSVTPTNEVCDQPNHPVAQRLANSFGVSYEEIIGWHCAGFGFGEIARAYLLADASSYSPETYFDMKSSGLGWGQIMHQTGVHPSELAPGRVIRHGNSRWDDDAEAESESEHGNNGNNGNGRGNGNGNNGNGRGNGRGNG